MVCPYNQIELLIALASIDPTKFTEERQHQLEKYLEDKKVLDEADLHHRVAEFHSISVGQLIASEHYEKLCREYIDSVTSDVLGALTRIYELTDVQAWAFLIESMSRLG